MKMKKKGLEQILEDKSSEAEIIQLAEKDLYEIEIKKEKYENELKFFYYLRMRMTIKMRS